MKHTQVQSSQIHSFGFENGVLEITFKGKDGPGSTYEYRGDSAQKHFDALMEQHTKGGSVGSYFIRNVKPDKALAYLKQEAKKAITP